MASLWTDVPVTSGTTDLQKFDWLLQFWKATAERAYATGNCNFVDTSFPIYSGTITGITNTVLTDSTATWCVGVYKDPFNCRVGGDTDGGLPNSYKVIIEPDQEDYTTFITAYINSNTATTITFDSIKDYFTSKQVAGTLSSLIGAKYTIIRGDYGVWIHDRLPDWPNAKEYAKGTVNELLDEVDDFGESKPDSPTKKFFRDNSQNWAINQFDGKDLLVYGDDGELHRVPLVKSNTQACNDHNTIYLPSGGTWTPAIDSAYVIVDTNARAYPSRDPFYPFWWYRGYKDNYASHTPDDEFSTADMPASTVKVVFPSFGDCVDIDEPVWDNDYHTPYPLSVDEQACGTPPDKIYAPELPKTIRFLQTVLENLSTFYVEDISYTGVNGIIPMLNAAEVFRIAGINNYSGTTGAVEGSSGDDGSVNNAIAVSGVSMPFYPIQVCYSIRKWNNDYNSGRGVMTASGRLLSDNSTAFTQKFDNGVDPVVQGDNARSIVISAGWSRFIPREFKRLYDQGQLFYPDVVTDSETGDRHAVDPADPVDFAEQQCFGVGRYVTKSKSTAYIQRKHESQTYTAAQGFADEDGDSFTSGDIARYVGDNFFDPTVQDGTVGGYFKNPSDTSTPEAPYLDRFYVGHLKQDHQNFVEGQRFGTATSGNTYFLQDTTQDWFNHGWGTRNGVMRVEEGTATSGSTTSLTDTTKAESNIVTPTNPLNCFWRVDRFGGANPFIGWVVEVDLDDGNGNTVTEKRLITASNATAVSLTWSEPLSKSASGRPYRIKEIYHPLNRWKGRTLKLTFNGVVKTTTITGSCEDTLFFTPIPADGDFPTGFRVTDTTTYEIVEIKVGSVLSWNGTAWAEKVSGTDSIRVGVPAAKNFHKISTENLPYYQKRFGRFIVGDAVCSEIFNELRRFIDALKWTKASGSWTAFPSAGAMTGDLNVKEPFVPPGAACEHGDEADGEDARTNAEAILAGWTAVSEEAKIPYSASGQFLEPTACDVGIGTAYSYYKVEGIPICHNLAHATVYYNYGFVDSLDSPQGNISDGCVTGTTDPLAAGIATCVDFPNGADAGPCVQGQHTQFVANGTSILFHQWNQWGSSSAGVTDTNYSPALGDLSIVEWCDVRPFWYCNDVDNHPQGRTDSCTGGWYCGDATAILKWNVAGGFKYYDTLTT